MSILTRGLPDCVVCRGEKYEVETDFRAWIEFYERAREKDIPGMLRVYRRLPPSLEEALTLAVEFGRKGASPYGEESRSGRAILDYEADAGLIYAAFMGEYGIDLCEEKLHWYKFCALLGGLGEDRMLSRIMALRGMDPAAQSDNKRRSEIRRLQRLYACPDRRTQAERDADAAAVLSKFY